MITHDMTEAILLADRIAVMGGGRLLAQAHRQNFPKATTPTSVRTPRRQAERLARCCLAVRHEHSPIRAGARRWATCPTTSATMSASALPRWRWDSGQPAPRDCGSHRRVARVQLGRASTRPDVPGLALLALSYPLLLALAALAVGSALVFRVRIFAGGAGAGALFDAAGAAQHHHSACRASMPPF
jgi:hypothetical protein